MWAKVDETRVMSPHGKDKKEDQHITLGPNQGLWGSNQGPNRKSSFDVCFGVFDKQVMIKNENQSMSCFL